MRLRKKGGFEKQDCKVSFEAGACKSFRRSGSIKEDKMGNNQDCGGSHIPGLHIARDSWLDKCKRARVEHLSKISIRGL